MVYSLILFVFLKIFGGCESPTKSHQSGTAYSFPLDSPSIALHSISDTILFYERRLERLKDSSIALKNYSKQKGLSISDKEILLKQINGIATGEKIYKTRVDSLKNALKNQPQKPVATDKKIVDKPTQPADTPKDEQPFAPQFLKIENGAKRILLPENNLSYLVYVVDLNEYEVEINWADTSKYRRNYTSFGRLLNERYRDVKDKVKMMMNGGIFKVAREANTHSEPLGYYFEKGVEVCPINTTYPNNDNFYLKPNGVFYWSEKSAGIESTDSFLIKKSKLKYTNAVQSGPMLLINDKYHPAFKKGSQNVNIRNGVGVTKDGKRLVFAISEDPTNFYDFATLFRHFGCDDALYLDGAISRAYVPEKNRKELNGSFASIITVLKK